MQKDCEAEIQLMVVKLFKFSLGTLNCAMCSHFKIQNRLIRRLAGTSWGAQATTLRTTALALIYSTAHLHGFAIPTHICLTDQSIMICTLLQDARNELTDYLSGIPPAELHEKNCNTITGTSVLRYKSYSLQLNQQTNHYYAF